MIKVKEKQGITLIALVITIIVLLILAGISISMLAGENGILRRATSAKEQTRGAEVQERVALEVTNNTINQYTGGSLKTRDELIEELAQAGKLTTQEVQELSEADPAVITIEGITIDFSGLPQKIQTWTQNGIQVTDGEITLTVGTAISGYGVTAGIDGEDTTIRNWYVLGAKDGQLLITTNTCPETVSLSGKTGYTEGVATLNAVAAKYSDGDLADSVRTLDYDDINRLTGFDPKTDGSNVGAVNEYGNKVTYTLKDNGTVSYQGTKQPTTETPSSVTSFEYYDGSDWITLNTGDSATLTCTYVSYSASSADSAVKTLLFTNTGNYPGDTGSYLLGSPYVSCGVGGASFGLRCVYSRSVNGDGVFSSGNGTSSCSMGLRPVVSLKSSVKVTNAGAVSK